MGNKKRYTTIDKVTKKHLNKAKKTAKSLGWKEIKVEKTKNNLYIIKGRNRSRKAYS